MTRGGCCGADHCHLPHRGVAAIDITEPLFNFIGPFLSAA
jgi:hypothetical protein